MTTIPPPIPPRDAQAAAAAAARFAAAAPADVRYAELETPVGVVVAVITRKGLARLDYEDWFGGLDAVLEDVAARLSPRILRGGAALDPVARELDEYFAGRRRTFDLPIDWTLVPAFGRRVLRATARIPYGEVATYGEVAARAGSPHGARAAGNALGANPVPIVVPCHRVVRAGGGLGGYTGGIERKQRLLAVERGEQALFG
ncbi:MAG TPA: methylated-DNA--[protein]-cysteine S-methyltransferase [Solirubrobacteraceae bacterium]|nr:methylated-DNA--[protein]-cysteine S-methyltransferase [Solirubrobacteraceae bacterium]